MNIKKIGIIFLFIQVFFSEHSQAQTLDFSRQIKAIQITGALLTSKNNYVDVLSNKVGNRILQEDLQKDINALYLQGNFHSVEARTSVYGNGIILEFRVTENPVIKNIRITGNTIFSSNDIKNSLRTKPGVPLNFKRLEEDITAVHERYVKNGYDLARISSTLLDQDSRLVIEISEGKMGIMKWDGLKKIKPFILEREMKSQQGLPFNSQFLRQDREHLLRLGYFSEISPPLLQENIENQAINTTFLMTEKNINHIDTGLELDTKDNRVVAFFKGDLNHAFLHSDLLSSKLQLSLEKLGLDVKSYSIHYSQPWILNRFNISYDTNVWLSIQDERTSDPTNFKFINNKRLGADAIFGFPLIREELKFSTRFKIEKISLTNPSDATNIQAYSVQSIAGILSYSSLDNRVNPRNGSYWTLELERGQDWGLVHTKALKFTRLSLNSAYFTSLSPKSVLGLHLFTGIFSPDETESFLTFEREIFELGGAGSLRGYKETNPFLGTREILVNAEYRYDLTESIQGVLFWDAGKTFNSGTELSFNDVKQGYGVGVRFSSPIGPLRFDVAQGESLIIHFSLGQLF